MHTYLERDLSSIEWRLENEKNPELEVLESFLEHLFTFRRRIFRYQGLLNELLSSIKETPTDSGSSTTPSTRETQELLIIDCRHVQTLFKRNAMRVNQILGIIIPLISIRDGKSSILQNRKLGLLTALATILLPFNGGSCNPSDSGSIWTRETRLLGFLSRFNSLVFDCPWKLLYSWSLLQKQRCF